MASPSQDGYPAFLVSPHVTSFQSYGMGSYVVFIQTKGRASGRRQLSVTVVRGRLRPA